MNAGLALLFFACFGACMADQRLVMVDELLAGGQQIAQSILGLVQQQILSLAQQATQQLQALINGLGGRFDLSMLSNFLPIIQPIVNNFLAQALGSLSSIFNLHNIIGGRAAAARITIGEMFQHFLDQITPAVVGLGEHFFNQGLSAVLGAIGSRGIADIFSGLTSQIAAVVSAGQIALNGVVSNLTQVVSGVLDASKPHWEQLQDQLVGHGLNVLNSLGQTINDLHGTITGGR